MSAGSAEARSAVRRAMAIAGQIEVDEAVFLYDLARCRGEVVEIGALFGRSTCVLAQAARVYGGRVTTIDPFVSTETTGLQSSAELWRANLRRAGLPPPRLWEMPSHAARAQWDGGEIALLFVDGAHDHSAVSQDIADWTPLVRVGGVAVFHDMFTPHIDGVALAITAWWAAQQRPRPWVLCGLVGHTIAFRRQR